MLKSPKVLFLSSSSELRFHFLTFCRPTLAPLSVEYRAWLKKKKSKKSINSIPQPIKWICVRSDAKNFALVDLSINHDVGLRQTFLQELVIQWIHAMDIRLTSKNLLDRFMIFSFFFRMYLRISLWFSISPL